MSAVQGFFLAGVLVAHATNRTANRLLAALVVAFTIHLVGSVYYATDSVARFPHFFGVSYPMPWLYGPLLYLYAVTASDRSRRLHSRDALHFLPLVLVLLITLPIYMMSGAEKVAVFGEIVRNNPPMPVKIVEPTKFVSGIGYSIATIMFLARHRARVKASYSSLDRVNLRWLLWLAGTAAAIWVMATFFNGAELVRRPFPNHGDDVVTLAIALVIYGIGYMGLRQPEIFRYELVDERTPTPPPATPPTASSQPAPVELPPTSPRLVPNEPRYQRSGLSQLEAASLRKALLALMDKEHPYRDPDLTLSDLSDRLDTTPHKLSEVLNTDLKQTFYDFVNAYRVTEVCHRIDRGDLQHRNVLTIALDAGFASKSTFNQVFKKQTGHTPSTYRRVKVG